MKKNHPIPKLPDAELDIMLVLWKAAAPCRIMDIFKALQETHPLSKPAIHTLLERLESRGFVRIITVDAPTPYKLVSPAIPEEEYRAAESTVFVDKLFRGSWKSLIATLVDTGRITSEDIDEISRLIQNKEEKK